ncbi:hypothetical protein CGLO_02942 [Colletotrichum gloeosporioides Cg-14]|uniref:Uncharacterized protein n=1 Tax=Colletotrichum gloeosporioides (strain Cg-14) TaxID=1237896 RepID=T0LZM8_COLGC|nr:hypothetical protein CGLO_02942 [Colletotrichum gloeosporioides Cg-14]
MAGPIAFDLS